MTVMNLVEDCFSFLVGNDYSCPLLDEAIFYHKFPLEMSNMVVGLVVFL